MRTMGNTFSECGNINVVIDNINVMIGDYHIISDILLTDSM